ncbi:MAG: hypothetical protein UU40_C0012G0010 [Candidatus Uhrbacteria bacterium GW2011_GWD2_41_121]|uniref:N-acetyltransferase domain-containing protein n=1 Tax=Candidatus Uhrbacteria bacterium GW2011_GWC1_41_20 TaxID=1618983 RepID=A0A0G0VDB6_9BACT|nr:MAG: hypothetical protein UT52_C0004G0010 [Candidatus Uhrbacteria bacterium GW2011_GWE1_39_46]KKR63794.1 MAG: hypothetical protein UU04_C0012G0032 [Candidatus Uhrbacteria bacterium GW2011_GWC2_40_450]KKR89902.1 MAG: hypothetical protein UU40_C0012G0010 [Candidatus Uhrbacteria bacterium GW2011_GWD2_41_121]KKR95772.1 MAG: hypothetical protein UU46_C0014G0010 [Candidatus Uhrbacteria bacterium GW2011_GWD1_41_16]KKR98884.1 MAG: hypothetical protein UU50_C0014G0016 [Candidatus Uhrbacteria bacteriu
MQRIAARDDMSAVVRIAETVQLNVSSPDPALFYIGFLVYTLSESQYARRLNPFFTVGGEGGATDGFLMCYESSFLRDLVEYGSVSHQDGAVDFLAKQGGRFIFGDQIGVDPSCNHRGLGTKLMQDMFTRMRREAITTMYVTILHEPVRNEVSIAFCTKLGATCIAEAVNQDGLAWGIYRFEP